MSCEGQVNVFQSDRVFLVRRQGRNVWRVAKSTQEYLKTLIQIGCSFQFLISHSKKISFFTSSSSFWQTREENFMPATMAHGPEKNIDFAD
jgi:hypothetical protein